MRFKSSAASVILTSPATDYTASALRKLALRVRGPSPRRSEPHNRGLSTRSKGNKRQLRMLALPRVSPSRTRVETFLLPLTCLSPKIQILTSLCTRKGRLRHLQTPCWPPPPPSLSRPPHPQRLLLLLPVPARSSRVWPQQTSRRLVWSKRMPLPYKIQQHA